MKLMKVSQWDVANSVAAQHHRPSFTQATVQSALSGRTRPPLDTLDTWADVLRLTGGERERWMSLAIGTHLPPLLADMIERWRVTSRPQA